MRRRSAEPFAESMEREPFRRAEDARLKPSGSRTAGLKISDRTVRRVFKPIVFLASLGPVASVITGATKPEQIQANAAASHWRLTDEELAEVTAIVT